MIGRSGSSAVSVGRFASHAFSAASSRYGAAAEFAFGVSEPGHSCFLRWCYTAALCDNRCRSQPSWPAKDGHPRLFLDAISKDVDGGAKPCHDDGATDTSNCNRTLVLRVLHSSGRISPHLRPRSARVKSRPIPCSSVCPRGKFRVSARLHRWEPKKQHHGWSIGSRSNRSALPCAIFSRSAGETGSASRNARARAFEANG